MSAPAPPHEIAVRVYYEDTDLAGVVYHANYLKFMERARSELLRAHGVDQRRLEAEEGLVFVVGRLEIDYRAPARFDDLLTVATAPAGLRRASATLAQTVRRGEAVLAEARVTIACIDRAGRPRRLPAALGAALGGA
jgi:acyl-CoA thioester hydrolase